MCMKALKLLQKNTFNFIEGMILSNEPGYYEKENLLEYRKPY